MSGLCKSAIWGVAVLGWLAAMGCQSPGPRESQPRESAVSREDLARINAETAELRRQAAELTAEHERLEAESAARRAEAEELQRLIEQTRAGREPAIVQPKKPATTRPGPAAPKDPPSKAKGSPSALNNEAEGSAETPAVRAAAAVQTEPAEAARPPAETQSAPAAGGEAQAQAEQKKEAEKQKEQAKKARERQRKLVRLESELEAAQLRLQKARLAAELAESNFAESTDKAEKELAIARAKFKVFQEISVPNRIARAELGLQMTEDGYEEAQQELDQLELMYSEDEFADKTKEIVIDRARRRLERSHRDLELRQSEYETLVNVTVPEETTDQKFDLEQKERGLEKQRRERATAVIEQRLAIMAAEAEVAKLQNELSDAREEIAEADQAAESGR